MSLTMEYMSNFIWDSSMKMDEIIMRLKLAIADLKISMIKIQFRLEKAIVHNKSEAAHHPSSIIVDEVKKHCTHVKNSYVHISFRKKPRHFKPLYILPIYPPSMEIRDAFSINFKKGSLANVNYEFCKYLQTPQLNDNNICDVFKILLQIEDVAIMSEYITLAENDIILRSEGTRRYHVMLQNMTEAQNKLTPFMDELIIVPKASIQTTQQSLQENPLDILMPHLHERSDTISNCRRHVAIVREIAKDRIYFNYNDEQLTTDTIKYNIIFRPCRSSIRYQYHALELLKKQPNVRALLFPTANVIRANQLIDLKLNVLNPSIANNPEQMQAVLNIVGAKNLYAPYIVFGPPGTGKTTTIVESILQLRLHQPGSRILVTAGSNSACDTIALRICNYFNSSRGKNFYDGSTDGANIKLLRIFSKSKHQHGFKNVDRLLIEHSNCSGAQGRNAHYYPDVETIRANYNIIVATLTIVGKLVTGNLGAGNFFTHIFIDEAGASTEPETLVGIMGIASPDCRIILCGDHRQLGPVLKSPHAAKLGLQQSLMERLLVTNKCYVVDEQGNYDSKLQTRLRRNYRSHPEIVRLYNHLYYDNELLAVAKEADINQYTKWHHLKNEKFPIIFQAVHGVSGREQISHSSFNHLEIQVLLWYLERLLVTGINGKSVAQTEVGIITPYNLQCRIIQQQLKDRSWDDVETGSVETFQGREKPIIIVSLVRSFAGLGFVGEARRLNVILSRAKSLLILIGNPVTLRHNVDLKFIIDECIANGTLRRKKKKKKHELQEYKYIKRFMPLDAISLSSSDDDDDDIIRKAIVRNVEVDDEDEAVITTRKTVVYNGDENNNNNVTADNVAILKEQLNINCNMATNQIFTVLTTNPIPKGRGVALGIKLAENFEDRMESIDMTTANFAKEFVTANSSIETKNIFTTTNTTTPIKHIQEKEMMLESRNIASEVEEQEETDMSEANIATLRKISYSREPVKTNSNLATRTNYKEGIEIVETQPIECGAIKKDYSPSLIHLRIDVNNNNNSSLVYRKYECQYFGNIGKCQKKVCIFIYWSTSYTAKAF